MKRQTKWLMLGIVVVTAVIIVVILQSLNSYKLSSISIPSKSLLAESSATEGTIIKIGDNWSAEGYPSVSFNPLAPSESTATSLSCRSANFLQQYYGGSSAAYQAKLDKRATCVKGMARGAILAQQIGDAQSSISLIDTSLETNRLSLAILNKQPNSLGAIIFPGGADYLPQSQTVTSPTIQCVKDSVTKTSVPEVPVGPSAISSSLMFVTGTSAQEKMILDVKAKVKAIAEDPKSSAFDKGQAVNAAMSSLIGKVLGVDPSSGRLFSHKSVLGRGVTIGAMAAFSAAKGDGVCDPSSLLCGGECQPPGGIITRGLVAGFSPYVTLDTKWFQTQVAFDELSVSGCLPYPAFLKMAIDGVNKHTATLNSLKSAHATRLAKLQTEYKTLRDNGYNCK